MKLLQNNSYRSLLVILCILLMHLAIGIYKIVPLRPQSIHQWAQCDRASVALNYYHDGMNFFLPRVHNLDNGTGITGMEFPFVNYTAALLYKIFGFHEWLYRLLTLFIYSLGLYFAYRIAFWWLNNFWQSLAITLIFACSPLLAFFSANFLPEPSCLAFALGAWFFLTRYLDTKSNYWVTLWAIFLALSCLIKISSLINMPAMLLLVWLKSEPDTRLKNVKSIIIYLAIIVVLTFSWYRYAMWLSEKTHSEIFLLESKFPKDLNDFLDVWKEVRSVWFSRIYNDVLLVVLFISLLFGLFLSGMKQKQLLLVTGVLFLSVLAFLFAMWTQLRHHDYYMIPMYPVFLFGLIVSVSLIRQLSFKFSSVVLGILMAGTIAFQFYESKTHVRTCFKKDSWKYSPLHFDRYFNIKNLLLNCGVKPEDRVISVFDHTPDVSLYLMDQKGVTVAYANSGNYFEQYLHSGMFNFVIYDKASTIEGSTFLPENYPLKAVYTSDDITIYRVSSGSEIRKGGAMPALSLSPWN